MTTYRVFTRHGWLASSAPSPDKTILTPMALILRDMRNMGVLARIVVVSYVSTMRTTCANRHTKNIHGKFQQKHEKESALTKGTVFPPASTDTLSRFNKKTKTTRARQHQPAQVLFHSPTAIYYLPGGRHTKDEGRRGSVADLVQCQR